jgi:hypothetical protein
MNYETSDTLTDEQMREESYQEKLPDCGLCGADFRFKPGNPSIRICDCNADDIDQEQFKDHPNTIASRSERRLRFKKLGLSVIWESEFENPILRNTTVVSSWVPNSLAAALHDPRAYDAPSDASYIDDFILVERFDLGGFLYSTSTYIHGLPEVLDEANDDGVDPFELFEKAAEAAENA